MIEDIYVHGPIKLDKFLKWANIVSTGGQAKIVIQAGEIKVNGSAEQKRGRVLKNGDCVQMDQNKLYRVCIRDKEL